jgi:hypothetical protein
VVIMTMQPSSPPLTRVRPPPVRLWLAVLATAIILGAAVTAVTLHAVAPAQAGSYEVWAIDQSDTRPDGGGTLYIYQGGDLAGRQGGGAQPEVIDLGDAARSLCLAQTGSAPRRPHMAQLNAAHTHAVIAWVASGHVLFMDAVSRRPLACIDAGEQAHAAYPAPNQQYVVIANQNGKLLQRIHTDYAANRFTLEEAATLNLATCKTPSGADCQDAADRPDNAPICPIVESGSRYTFVTLRGGGLFVVDTTATPMAIVAEYSRLVVAPNGCGGVERDRTMYLNSGGGTPATPLSADLYAFPLNEYSSMPAQPNHPLPRLVFSERGTVDSHGAALVGDGRYLWVNDRAAGRTVVVDTTRNVPVGSVNLTGALSDRPAPDLLEASPAGDWAFATLRGPLPLTGNAPGVRNAVGSTPGVAVIRVNGDGSSGELIHIARISHLVDGNEAADPHGIFVRRRSASGQFEEGPAR